MAETTYRVTYQPAARSGLPCYAVLVAASSPAEARRLAEPRARIEAPRHRYASTAAVKPAGVAA
jgi:hypothetical protein